MQEARPWAFAAKLLLPGDKDTELYVALVFSGENLATLEHRLSVLDARAQPGKEPATNNTRFLLHRTGFYATVMQERDRIDPELETGEYGEPVPVDEIVYADVERSGRLSPAEVDIVNRLRRDFNAPEKILRLESDGAVIQAVPRPEQLSIREVTQRTRSLGGHYSNATLEAFHLNLTHNYDKHFVILRGISGTGKSRLAKCYAYAVLGADSLAENHDRFIVVAVEPQWTDPTFLLGHQDVLDPAGYRRTAFLDALLLAHSDPMQPVFVLLDEMNRAQVEHYFASLLSAMEIEGAIRFHSVGSETIPGVPPEIPWPKNLYLIGTVNDDESVLPFSGMVLDRANSQDLSYVDVKSFSEWLRETEPALAEVLTDQVVEYLAALGALLAPFQLHFGNRTVREIALYLLSAKKSGATIDALDYQIDQKILPKLRGGEECSRMLLDLIQLLDGRTLSQKRVMLMKSDLDQLDFFKYR
ncbi:McrB family protein [Arthrobacter sp. NyZ413]|uniref:McrB family protein n=1 Tax=Arthrobacter sp. NyZ413 TaxID=3144669 RepID=UPI003BF81CF1